MSERRSAFHGVDGPRGLWRKMAAPRGCGACGAPAEAVIHTNLPLDYVLSRPDLAARIALLNGGRVPRFRSAPGYPTLVPLGKLAVCRSHRKEAEQEAARGASALAGALVRAGSYLVVHVDEGPRDVPVQVGYRK